MSGLTMTQTCATDQRLDMSPFTPQRLAGQSLEQIRRLPLRLGNQQVTTGELFELSGQVGERIAVHPIKDNLDQLGAGMRGGELIIEGAAGWLAGAAMQDGLLRIIGNTGDRAGAGMQGGRLSIDGNTGERLGGPLGGHTRGMSGGLIQVRGDAGDRAGERLRRGTVLIHGDSGDYCGVNMIAGSILVAGQAGRWTGSGMRRGSLLLQQMPDSLPSSFSDNGLQRLGFLALLVRQLGELTDLPEAFTRVPESVGRYLGDLADGGLGEVLICR